MKSLAIAAVLAAATGFAVVPGVALADPTGNACAHIATLGPGGDGQGMIVPARRQYPAAGRGRAGWCGRR